MHKEMDMWYIKSLALHCFSVASWRFEHRTSLKGDHCLHTCAGKHQPYWHAIHNFQTRTVYKVKVSDFIMSLFTISGLQLLYDCKKIHCTPFYTSLFSSENLFMVIFLGQAWTWILAPQAIVPPIEPTVLVLFLVFEFCSELNIFQNIFAFLRFLNLFLQPKVFFQLKSGA